MTDLLQAFKDFKLESETLSPLIKAAAFSSAYYPHDKPLKTQKYEKKLRLLQIELLKLQKHVKEQGLRVVIVFEGRDAAGKGGAIARLTQHLNPRSARVVALSKPTEQEKGQLYFQRYIKELPSKGEMVVFDRSWYNRAVVEPVMGFCTEAQTNSFLETVPVFEKMLTDDGIIVIKFWLHVGHAMQLKRLHERFHDPLSTWKISPIDIDGLSKWDDFTKRIEAMLSSTNQTPWVVVHANDKKRTRLAVIKHILSQIDYAGKEAALLKKAAKITLSGEEFLKQGAEE